MIYLIPDSFKASEILYLKMPNKPLITVIIATFNIGDAIEKSILSVVNQSYNNIQFIIIDGGSSDGSLEIIKKYSDKISFWVSEKDKGIYDAWNKGLKYSKGDWISFLGGDDEFLPDAIENYVNYITDSNFYNYDFISSKVKLVDQRGNKLNTVGRQWKWSVFKKYMNIAHVGSLHSKHFFEKYGWFDVNFKIAGDYEILLRAKDKLKAGYLEEVTVNMRIGGVSNNTKVFNETRKAKIKNKSRNFIMAFYDMLIAKVIFFLRSR